MLDDVQCVILPHQGQKHLSIFAVFFERLSALVVE